MITLDASQLALIASDAVGLVYLVELDFSAGTYRFTSFNQALTVDTGAGANTYTATGALGSVGDIKESQDTDAQTLAITLSVADSAILASALGNVEGYRGRKARIYLQLMHPQTLTPIGPPRLRFTGEMEPVKITRDKPGEGGGPVGGSIELPITRSGMSRARNADGLRLTNEQQLAEYSGDVGLEYVRALIEKPSLWLSKRFQEQ